MTSAAVCERSEPLLESASKLVGRVQWHAVLYPQCGEAVLYMRGVDRFPVDAVEGEEALLRRPDCGGTSGDAALSEAEAEAAAVERAVKSKLSNQARARTKARRYCKANGVDRLFTLTYERGCTDPDEVAEDVRGFFKRLREGLGGERFPYLWVRELHAEGGRFHVHFGLAQPVPMRCERCDPDNVGKGVHRRRWPDRPCLRCTWGHGFVHAKLLRSEARSREASTVTAQYLAKYVGKAFDDGVDQGDGDGKRRHRYEVGQGFKPVALLAEIPGPEAEVRAVVAGFFGRPVSYCWSSSDCEGWDAPPVRVLFFDASG